MEKIRRIFLSFISLLAVVSASGVNPLRTTDSSFFATPQAQLIGLNMLNYQRVTGGWPKNIDMSRTLSDEEMKAVLSEKGRTDDSTTDNGATTMQMAYLARLFNATRNLNFANGFQRGVGYLLSGQYENGGWPQFWPGMRGYQKHITYNDEAMVSTMRVLRDIAEARAPYNSPLLCDEATRKKCAEAFRKGVECILSTQIVVDGEPTVWCQQHDRESLKPAGARAYELPSFSSQESAGLVSLLMEIPDPDERIIKSVNAAMRWFERNKMTGVRVVRDPGPKSEWNTRLEADSTATPLWARFYGLDSCKAYVCDRDGVPRRSLDEIGVERRNGYSWFCNWPMYLYPVYDRWADKYCPEQKVELDYSGVALAFPGAEGYGRFASGGRGGRVYHVTTLEDGKQKGTLRYALEAKGVRTVVFDVAGTIFLDRPLHVVHGDLTVAGQTAPSAGICIAGQPVSVMADNVIIRYLRFRVGNRGGGEPDGFQCTRCRNLIVDHCSVSWSVDECCSVYGCEDATLQWCLVSESLRSAGHHKGRHGYGAIWGGARASFHHNLLAHHDSRAPRLGPHADTQTREFVDMRCNVIYNWSGNGCYGAEGMKINIVNNYYKPGPATPRDGLASYRIVSPGVRTKAYCTRADGTFNRWKPMEYVWGAYYVDGNVIEGKPEVTADNWTKGVYAQIRVDANDGTFTDSVRSAIRLSEPLGSCGVSTQSAKSAYSLVLADAGCSHVRDELDLRVIEDVRNGRASRRGSISPDADVKLGLIDVPEDAVEPGVFPWPDLSVGGRPALVDADGDGMPDEWELANGLDPNDASDGAKNRKGYGAYTNLEVYINSL